MNDFEHKRRDDLQPDTNENIDDLTVEQDVLMEQILDNINHTPLGQVLKKIASLPEVRCQKVMSARRRISQGEYELDECLDRAMERVLEDLTA